MTYHFASLSNTYLKIAKILNVIEVLDVLLVTEIPQDAHITVCSFISSEYVVVRYDDKLFTVPDLQVGDRKKIIG